MLGSQTLETAIGLVLLFTVLSLAATALREIIEAVLQARAVQLERGIRELLRDPDGTEITRQLFDHPLISNLFRGDYDPATQLKAVRAGGWKRLAYRSNLPAYIPSRNVALALMDLAAGNTDGREPLTVARIRDGIGTLPNAHLRRALNVALSDTHGDLARVRENLEHWFDSGMDRVSGWYRKQTQWILFAIGLAFALLLNIDTIGVARALYLNGDMRAVIVAQAQEAVERGRSAGQADAATALGCASAREIEGMSCAQQQLAALPLPIGWGEHRVFKGVPWRSLPGWLITSLAVSLGAPFWFDLLNKMMVIRSTVKPHEKSQEEASEDRQAPKPTQAVKSDKPAETDTPPPG